MIRMAIIVVLTLAAGTSIVSAVVSYRIGLCTQVRLGPHTLIDLELRSRFLGVEMLRSLDAAFLDGWVESSGVCCDPADLRYTGPAYFGVPVWGTGVGTIPYMSQSRVCLDLPHWAILFVVYPTIAFFRGPLRRHRLRERGLCVTCGYDLTGSAERCPECGSEAD